MRTTTRPLSPAGSLLLDAVRLSAALMVAFGHVTGGPFSTGWVNRTRMAQGAVTVFFILSGFVIRHVTLMKPGSLTQYAIDRASRMYSVVLPAIAFTYFADWISCSVNPGFYMPNFGLNYSHFLSRAVVSILFLTQLWHKDVRLLSNSPFWSLSFECFYYLIYGLAFYLRGYWRFLLIAAAFIVVGPGIVIFTPLWLLGCVLHWIYQRTRGSMRVTVSLGTLISFIGLCFVLSHRLRSGLDYVTYGVMEDHYSYARALGSQWVIAVPVFLILLFGLLVADGIPVRVEEWWARLLRYAAEATFPLYLFHFPLYVLIASLTNYNRANPWIKLSMLAFAFGIAMPLGSVLNILKYRMRLWFTSWLTARPVARPARVTEQPAIV